MVAEVVGEAGAVVATTAAAVAAAEVAAVMTTVGIEPRLVFQRLVWRKPVPFHRPRGKRLPRELLGSFITGRSWPGIRRIRNSADHVVQNA